MAMMHIDLVSHYERIFAFKQYHGWAIEEVEELMPWEFEVVTSLLMNYLEAKDAQRKQDIATQNSLSR